MTNSRNRSRSIRRCGGAALFAVFSFFGLVAVAEAETITTTPPAVPVNGVVGTTMHSLGDGSFRSDHKCGFWDGLVGN